MTFFFFFKFKTRMQDIPMAKQDMTLLQWTDAIQWLRVWVPRNTVTLILSSTKLYRTRRPYWIGKVKKLKKGNCEKGITTVSLTSGLRSKTSKKILDPFCTFYTWSWIEQLWPVTYTAQVRKMCSHVGWEWCIVFKTGVGLSYCGSQKSKSIVSESGIM